MSTMTDYVVTAELAGPELTDTEAEEALNRIDPYPTAIGTTAEGHPSITVTHDSSNLAGAIAGILPMIRYATERDVVAVAAMTEAERDAREGL